MNRSRLLANLGLLIAAIIWGSTFVAQSAGAELVETFTYQSTRSFIGAAVLLPVIFLRDRTAKRKPDYIPPTKKDRKLLIIAGICCGIALTVAACLQQYGIKFTTVGKSGFITALYVVFVPITGLFFKKRVRFAVWISVLLAAVGLYLLCMTDASFSLSVGDTFVLLCALCFTMHIMIIDHFDRFCDPVKMSAIQFFTSGVISGILMFIFEKPDLSNILAAWLPIAYAGVLSSGVAYTLQVVCQKHTDPTVASLLMSLESVFAVLSGALVLREIPTPREAIGCIIMFAAIILAQLPPIKLNKNKKELQV